MGRRMPVATAIEQQSLFPHQEIQTKAEGHESGEIFLKINKLSLNHLK